MKVLLKWTDPTNLKTHIVGDIERVNSLYLFKYGYDIDVALQSGFSLLIPFEDKNKTYQSDFLFPCFSCRLPDKNRKDIGKILNKYKLNEYDELKLLASSGGKLPIDTLFFE